MERNDDMDFDEGMEDHHSKLVESGLRKPKKRKTVRGIDTPFNMPGYGIFENMSNKMKIPRQRNAYLREAFFKCYFHGQLMGKERTPTEILRQFAKLFYYHQEVRIETRVFFDRFDESFLKENRYTDLKKRLIKLINDGCKTIDTVPRPKIFLESIKKLSNTEKFESTEQQDEAILNHFNRSDLVDITFDHKKRDFPRPEEIFCELAGKDFEAIKEKNGRMYIPLLERDHSTNNYIHISGKLWVQAFALLVQDAVEEMEQEIINSGVHYAYIPQPSISASIDHFDQTYHRASDMDNREKAYSISHRYKNKISDTPLKRDSVYKAFKRQNKPTL